ncbi:MAG: hypothetical protein ACXADB_00990 [Candidatus Hermodarchaeia archaeon]|jgi:hypothetical protein
MKREKRLAGGGQEEQNRQYRQILAAQEGDRGLLKHHLNVQRWVVRQNPTRLAQETVVFIEGLLEGNL